MMPPPSGKCDARIRGPGARLPSDSRPHNLWSFPIHVTLLQCRVAQSQSGWDSAPMRIEAQGLVHFRSCSLSSLHPGCPAQMSFQSRRSTQAGHQLLVELQSARTIKHADRLHRQTCDIQGPRSDLLHVTRKNCVLHLHTAIAPCACKLSNRSAALVLMKICRTYPATIVHLSLNGELYPIHESFLTAVSPYFKDVLQQPSEDSSDRCLDVEDIAPVAIVIFCEWLYSRALRRPNGQAYFCQWTGSGRLADENALAMDAQVKEELIEVYIFADRYDIPQLRRDVLNAFMRTVIGNSASFPGPGQIKHAYDHLASSTPLVRFLIDTFSYAWNGLGLGGECRDYPPEFILAVLSKILRAPAQKPTRNPLLHPCDYHEHRNCTHAAFLTHRVN